MVKDALLASSSRFLDILSTFSSWITRWGSYLTDLSKELLQSLVRTPCSLARVGFGYPFYIFVLDNPTGFVPNRLVLRSTPVLWLGHLTRLARVSFGYSSNIFVLDNPTGFIPNRLVLRVTPVPGEDTLLACSSRLWISF